MNFLVSLAGSSARDSHLVKPSCFLLVQSVLEGGHNKHHETLNDNNQYFMYFNPCYPSTDPLRWRYAVFYHWTVLWLNQIQPAAPRIGPTRMPWNASQLGYHKFWWSKEVHCSWNLKEVVPYGPIIGLVMVGSWHAEAADPNKNTAIAVNPHGSCLHPVLAVYQVCQCWPLSFFMMLSMIDSYHQIIILKKWLTLLMVDCLINIIHQQ